MRWLALFVALCATAVAATPLLDSRDVANGSVTAADVRDGSLRERHLHRGETLPRGLPGDTGPPGPQGPQSVPSFSGEPEAAAYGVLGVYVRADGTLRDHPPQQSPGVSVAHVSAGTYCVTLPTHEWVDVTSASLAPARRVAVEDATGDPGCPTRVTVAEPVTPSLDDGPFLIVWRDVR